MLQTFSSGDSLSIVLTTPICDADIMALREELSKEYSCYHLEFGRVYNLDIKMVNMLYNEMFIKQKNISIVTHTNHLNRYLKTLGFPTKFVSLMKEYVVDVEGIEVVLIGGSADSSPKIVEVVQNVNLKNISLVIVQHVEMDKKGVFDEILQYYTKHQVKYAQEKEKLQKGCIYIAPESKHLKIKDGHFHLCDDEKYNFSKPSISLSYESFSNYYKDRLLVIQECGHARDGVDKLALLKENKSKLIIQDIKECKARSMVENSLVLKLHDYIFTLKEMIRYINFINKVAIKEVWVEYLLYTIYEKYSYDIRFYHRDTINRRLEVFMIKHEIKSIKNAIGIILFNKVAFKSFFLELSINVTELFRHPKSLKHFCRCSKRELKAMSIIFEYGVLGVVQEKRYTQSLCYLIF